MCLKRQLSDAILTGILLLKIELLGREGIENKEQLQSRDPEFNLPLSERGRQSAETVSPVEKKARLVRRFGQ